MYTEQSKNAIEAQVDIDPIIQIAIQDGLKQVSDSGEEYELRFPIQLSAQEQEKLKKLSGSMALSSRIIIESAVNYLYFYLQKKPEIEPSSLFKSFDSPPQYRLEIQLDLETQHKLKILNLQNHVSESVVAGIHLLYHALVETIS